MGAAERMVDDDGVVRIGSVVFALMRPTAGHERAFNHWYERDHFYTAGLAAPGVFSAGRFIHPDSGWHLALYFVLPGHDEARIAFATEQLALAADDDRLFAEREHLHTWSHDVESAARGTDNVPLALALDHRYPGLHVSMYDGEAPRVAGPALTLRARSRVMPADWDAGVEPGVRRILLQFGDAPAGVGDAAVWSGAFVPMVIGTDTHITE
jgi:hypothetical protein